MSARRSLSALVSGLLFGVGLTLSGMLNPTKVQDFLDFTGSWDPSLALVMGGALLVTFFAFPRILKRPHPLFATRFHVPMGRHIDGPLLAGAVLFGLGWGLAGFCPGPALAGAATGARPAILFTVALLAGMAIHRVYDELRRPQAH